MRRGDLEDMVKRTTLDRWAHAVTHTDELLNRRVSLAGNEKPLTIGVERVSEASGRCHVLVVA